MKPLVHALTLLLAWAALLRPGNAQAQVVGNSFSCDGTFYQTRQQGTGTSAYSVLYRVDRSTATYTTRPFTGGSFGTTGTLSFNGTNLVVNALAYNSQNGYLYAVAYPADNGAAIATPHIYQIGQSGVQDLGATNLPTYSYASGTFDKKGNYYLTGRETGGQGTVYRINVATNPLASTALKLRNSDNTADATAIIYDLGYNPTDNSLYGVYTDNYLVKLVFPTGVPLSSDTYLKTTAIGSTTNSSQIIGTCFFDISGRLYTYSNGTVGTANTTAVPGKFYTVNLSTGVYTLLSSIDPVSSSDGASCINPLQRLDVTKDVTNVVGIDAVTFDISYAIRVRNTGTIVDSLVQVSDFLRGTTTATSANTAFPTSTSATIATGSLQVNNLDGSTLAINPNFNGTNGNAALLTGIQLLQPSQRAVITYTVRVVFPANAVPTTAQNNTAYGTVTSSRSNNTTNRGYTQSTVDGTLLPPDDLQANDASANSADFAVLRSDTDDTGDTASPTPVIFMPSISGIVFEDVNYGGGLGRDQGTSTGVGRSGARVELYNVANGVATYTATTTTAADGSYSFSNLTKGNSYVVRVLSNSVSSRRNTGSTAALVGVQTYRTNVTATAGTIPDQNRVGGEYPKLVEAGNGTSTAGVGTVLSMLNTTTAAAESISNITLSTFNAPAVDVNFGYNFDTVVNTNDTGQGSLRQFITNANALDNTNLVQMAASSGGTAPATGVERSIFMITDGLAHDGLTAYSLTNQGLATQLTNGVAVITPASALPALAGAYGSSTSLDATTQAQNIGNTNTATLGAGGTVGTGGTALGTVAGPEVQLTGSSSIATGLNIANSVSNILVKGLSIYDFGNAKDNDGAGNIVSAGNNVTLTQNVIGSAATAFTAPATLTNADNVRITGGTGLTITNNLIGFSNGKGIALNQAEIGAVITNNEIRNNGQNNSGYDGIDIQGSQAIVTGNLVVNNAGTGIDSFNSLGSNNISGNTVTSNGKGTTSAGTAETPGLRIYGTGNTLSQNVIYDNYGAGVLVTSGAKTTTISQNSIYNNGNVAAATTGNTAASGEIGIDLEASTDDIAKGTSPYVTLNNAVTTGTNANGLINYPVLTSVTVVGSNLLVQGYAKAGATIELFTAQANPASVNATGANFGQGRTYLATVMEGSAADLNTRTNQSYGPTTNGFAQGSDTNANGFSFLVPLSSLPAAGTLLTSTATLNGATSEFSGNVKVNLAPTANNVTNAAVLTTSVAAVLTPNLSATPNGAGVTIASYTITDLTNINGTLAYNGTTLTAANIATTVITDLTKLTYKPTLGFSGNATFSYSATDSNGAPSNTATYTIPVSPVADVVAAFPSSNPTAATAASALTLTVNFTNAGPNTAAGVTRSVQLPAGLGTVTATNGTYNNTTGLVTFTTSPTTLATTDNLNATITISSVPVGMSSVTAVAVIATTTSENGVTANNTATITVPVAPSFDLATTLNGPTTLVDGTIGTYTITTRNNGPSAIGIPAEGTTAATGAVQTLQLPTGLSGVFATNGGTYNSSTGVVTFPDVALASGQVVTNTVSFSVASGVMTFTPQAVVAKTSTLSGTETNTANNTAYLNGSTSAAPATTTTSAPTGTTPATTANLYVTATGPAVVTGGAVATYTITQGNSGPLAASGVQTQVSLPTGQTVASLSLTLNGTTATGTLSNGVITFNNGGATYTQATGLLVLPALTAPQASAATPQSYTIGITAPTTTLSSSLTVTATVGSTTSDIMPANNVASVTTEIQPLTDVSIALVSTSLNMIAANGTVGAALGNGNLLAGQTASFEVQASNTSTNLARNVQQTVTLPSSLDGTTLRLNGVAGTLSNGVFTFASGATYTVATGALSLPAIADLMGGAVQTTLLSFTVPANNTSGLVSLPLSAAISTSTLESNSANNAASLAPKVASAQDVAVSLAGPTQAVVGNPVLYTVSTANNGPSANGTQTTTVTLPTTLDPTTLLVNNAASTSNSAGVYTYTYPSSSTVLATYTASTGVLAFSASGVSLPKSGLSTVNTFQFVAPDVTLLNAVANVTTSATDLNLANNSAQVITPLSTSNLASLDLVTTLTSTGSSLTVGSSRTYSVTTTNSSTTTTATSVAQTLVLPAGLTSNGGTVTTTNGGVYNNLTGVVTFTVGTVGTTAVTNSATFLLPASASGSDASGYSLVVTGSSFTANPETNLTNNTVQDTRTVGAKFDLATTISGPTAGLAGATVAYTVAFANNGPSQASGVTGTITLPAGVTAYTLTDNAGTTTTGTASGTPITVRASNTMLAGTTEMYTISFTAPTSTFSTSANIATSGSVAESNVAPNSASVTTVINQAPVAYDVVNKLQTPEGNTAKTLTLTPLNASDADGNTTIASYTITSIPNSATQGTLAYNGTTLTTTNIATTVITDPTKLTFTPVASFVGNAFFTYTATDNGNGTAAYALTSAPARYTIQVGQDNNSFYTATPAKGGSAVYVTNDVLAYVIDPNGSAYTSGGLVYNTTGTLQTGAANGLALSGTNAVLATSGNGPTGNTANTLPTGVALDPTTGKIYVSNASLLPHITQATTYSVNVITTDVNGGTNQITATFTIGAYPLPVELTAFTAQAVANRDALLNWTTASELNSAYFDVERSLDGTTFAKIGQVTAQGTKLTATTYSLTDAGIAAKVSGPVYYRLRQVDQDGTATYSAAKVVSFTKATTVALSLYPNPAKTITTLDLSALPTTGSYHVMLLDATGRQVLATTLAGGAPQQLDVTGLASGTYNVLVTGTQPDGSVLRQILRLIKE